MPAPGQEFGQYRLLEQVGEGGMATVFLADDLKHGRRVALKLMKPGHADAVGRDRFQREIEIAARLSHPHIVPLHDSGLADGEPFYVMPYVEGESLRARLQREAQLPLEDVLQLAREIAGALDHAHEHGLVHRDIKPENILISHGIALVADFGVARPARAELDAAAETRTGAASLTRVGLVIGTPQYMAPEQALGGDVDGRTDVYALGCVVFEMLAGQPPFTGGTAVAVLLRHLNEAVPALRPLHPGLPDGIVHAIERALAKSPADRFATAGRFAEALEAAAGDASSHATTPPAVEAPTVAVLPFQQIGGAADEDYLSDGICDELIHALGRIAGLRVIARGSSFLFRERRTDVRAIGEQLRVGYLVDGTLRRAGKRLRVTTQLIEASNGFQLWSERYDREIDDVFALEDDIAGSIAKVIQVQLTGGAGGRPGPAATPSATPAPLEGGARRLTSVEAYERYLMGLQHWNRRLPAEFDRAVEDFSAAVQTDPGFAPAWGALALCYVTQLMYGLRRPDEVVVLARAAVHEALRTDPAEPFALTARATARAIHDWDFDAAERDFREGLAVNPSNATVHQWYAMNVLAPLGRFDEARASLEHARALDPLSPMVLVSLGFVAYLEREDARALEQYRQAQALDSAFAGPLYFAGLVLTAAGRLDEAVQSLEAAAGRHAGTSPEVLAALADAYAQRGDRERALAVLADLEARAARHYLSPALTAIVRLGLGEREGALRDLERALDVRATEMLWLDVRPTWSTLRDDPRFQSIVARRAAGKRAATIS